MYIHFGIFYYDYNINVITNQTLPGDDSKELLITSDSNNGYRRNYTRRPSSSRLTPYRPKHREPPRDDENESTEQATKSHKKTSNTKNDDRAYTEENLNVEDLGLFEEFTKENPEQKKQNMEREKASLMGGAPYPPNDQDGTLKRRASTEKSKPVTRIDDDIVMATPKFTKLGKTNKYERVIDGAALLKVR